MKEGVVENSGRRVTDQQVEPHPELIADGWQQRFIGDPQRTAEAVELYSQMGYEVRTEPVKPMQLDDNCKDCLVLALCQFKTIYTRKIPKP